MPRTEGRPLTAGERELARSVFGDAIDCAPVRLHHRKWFPFHPKKAVMAPDGHIWVHPQSGLWRDDYAAAPLNLQGLLLHELTHVWQAQQRGRWYLPLMRHPFCSYKYKVEPGWPLERYGLEQQGEIVRHVHLLRNGVRLLDGPSLAELERILPFRQA